MKKATVTFIHLWFVTTVFAQGLINFNYHATVPSTAAVIAPIYGVDPAHPTDLPGVSD